jgi:hypothetical protein
LLGQIVEDIECCNEKMSQYEENTESQIKNFKDFGTFVGELMQTIFFIFKSVKLNNFCSLICV